jgi:AraC family transcriptional regulator
VSTSLIPHPMAVQWYSDTRIQKLTSSDVLGWTNMELDVAEHAPVSDLRAVPYDDHDVVSFLIKGSLKGQSRINGSLRHYAAGAGMMFVIPRHTEFETSWDAPWTNGALRLNPGMVHEAAAAVQAGDPAKIQLLPNFFFNDAALYRLGIELANELQSANPLGVLYAEALTNALILHLLRHYSNGQRMRDLSNSRLPPTQLRRVVEYIQAHLDQKISLADLADCLHLSVPHFERMFRTTTRRAPYRYVLDLRLERARVLLEQAGLSLVEVAAQCGFSSQSHFTAHFTQYVGVSPARFARKVREQSLRSS